MGIKRILGKILVFAYLLGVKDGFITLWKDGAPEPIQVFPYRADSLPESDQKALEKGIPIDDKTELLHILEDYLS